LPGTEALLLGGLRPLIFEILDRERVAGLQHLDAGAALLRDRLSVLGGADTQRDHAASKRIGGGPDDVAVFIGPVLCDGTAVCGVRS
jgi:hypothetical protein